MKKIILMIATTLFTILLLCACGKQHHDATLTWATEAAYPPFEYTTAQGEIVGMDVAIAKAICLQIKQQDPTMHGLTCRFVNAPWNSLIPSLQVGKFDIVWGAMNITAARAKQVSFTQSYYAAPAVVIAAKNVAFSLDKESIQGKVVGVQQGNTFANYLQKTYGSAIAVKMYASVQQAFLDLQNGRLDAVMTDHLTAYTWLKSDKHNQQFSVLGKPIQSDYFDSGYGIAVDKNNTVLLAQLNQAIAALKRSGELQAIINQYL